MTYEPGTVAVATVRGVPNVRLQRVARCDEFRWIQCTAPYEWATDSDVTDVRPLCVVDPQGNVTEVADQLRASGLQLVVLDLSMWDDEFIAKLSDWLRMHAPDAPSSSLVFGIADQIEQQTKPPKPEEPQGAGAIITARRPACGQARLIRTDVPSPRRWVDPDGDFYLYSELDGVIIRSEGWGEGVVND